MTKKMTRGYTLIELIVAVGIFALVMTLAAGSYLLMVDLNRQAQGIATGIDSLSFALESMTRTIRTGTSYSCGNFGGDCAEGAEILSLKDSSGSNIIYARGTQGPDGSIGDILQNDTTVLTDPSVNVSSLRFYVSGTGTVAENDFSQPYITIVISGTVSSGPRKTPQPFTIETGAAMRGIDFTVPLAPSENPAMPACTLSANPTSVLSGGSATLTWSTTNTTSFSINQGVPPVSPVAGGSISVSPSFTTTYTGTAINAAGSSTCTVRIEVIQ